MRWTRTQLLQHPKASTLLGINTQEKGVLPATSDPPAPPGVLTFTVMGPPMGKPRMTRRDTWKKRPVVLRYRDYCDRIKEAAPNLLFRVDVHAIDITAHLAMPRSWSKKKKTELCGKPCRQRPDWDNIGKAVCDALFKDDSRIADGRIRKFWCHPGEQRTEIKLRYRL